MSEKVNVPYGKSPKDTATLLLAAADDLELSRSVVETNGRGEFIVPAEVNEKAFGKQESKAPAKKASAPAKKAAAKKTTAKKTAAKKSTTKKATAGKSKE